MGGESPAFIPDEYTTNVTDVVAEVANKSEGLLKLVFKDGKPVGVEHEIVEKNHPDQLLLKTIDAVRSVILGKENSNETDVAIMEQLKERFRNYLVALKENKANLEAKMGKELTYTELEMVDNGKYVGWRQVPVSSDMGDGMVRTYDKLGRWKDGVDMKNITNELKNNLQEQGIELLTSNLSDQGIVDLFQGLGVMQENESVQDIPTIFDRKLKAGFTKAGARQLYPTESFAIQGYSFDTNIPGVYINFRDHIKGSRERLITLDFDNEFHEQFLNSKNK